MALKTTIAHFFNVLTYTQGCCPSEAEVQEVILSVEDTEIAGSVHLSTFLPVVSNLLAEYK